MDTMVPVDTTVYRGTSKDIYMISRERHCVYGWMDRCYTWFVAVGQDASGEISQQKLRMSKFFFGTLRRTSREYTGTALLNDGGEHDILSLCVSGVLITSRPDVLNDHRGLPNVHLCSSGSLQG